MIGKQLIENWFAGNVEEKMPPHSLLKSSNVKHIKNSDKMLRMMKSFIVVVKKHTVDEDALETDSNKWNASYVKLLWEKVGIPYLNVKFGGKHRMADVGWKTMCVKMVKKKAFV